MSSLILIIDLRLPEDDRQNVLLEELTVGSQLDPKTLLELGQDFAHCFFYALAEEVSAFAEELYQPVRQEEDKR